MAAEPSQGEECSKKRITYVLIVDQSTPNKTMNEKRWPGCNFESLTAVRHALIDNHTRYYIFRNYIKFHNYVTHRALAIYALGGSGPVIEAFYKRDIKIQRDAFVSPHPITAQNFVDHLGDAKKHQADKILTLSQFLLEFSRTPALRRKVHGVTLGNILIHVWLMVAEFRDHVQKWTVNLSRPGEIERKMEECIWILGNVSSRRMEKRVYRRFLPVSVDCNPEMFDTHKSWDAYGHFKYLHSSHPCLLEHKPYFSAHTSQVLLHGSWHAADPS
ncbi:uncharacterized protein F5891DRAFT_1223956 [Suillus fuscotomentosus]|uniref:Uncharacterized protein n=1 Tax=Suillus fuscotomentosus TaxID=1912939 RepID=A0AAD4HLQ1_9AGAM|nr:uncharacterized protein F5891DRAFT_1223956 [Suillus fuscotomentosus]KAG1901243.1 hypothetical protein F5891DRAFT_1223956 [Suillus fuscotomentosus]